MWGVLAPLVHPCACSLPGLQLLAVLRGALALGNPRLAEPALSCMHKLVAYAYLQGETASNGRLDDDNVVTQASTPHSTAQHSVGSWLMQRAARVRWTAEDCCGPFTVGCCCCCYRCGLPMPNSVHVDGKHSAALNTCWSAAGGWIDRTVRREQLCRHPAASGQGAADLRDW